MIPANDERVAVEHGRTAFAVSVQGMHPAEVLLPLDIPIELEAIEAARTEKPVEPFAVSHGRARSQASGLVSALVRPFFAQDFHPGDAPVAPVTGPRQK